MKINWSLNIALLIVVFYTVSCTGDDNNDGPDTIKPQAEIISPEQDQLIIKGGPLIFSARFTDNRELAKCEISLLSLKSAAGIDEPWTPVMEMITLSGQQQQIEERHLFQQAVPADILGGSYNLLVDVYDEAGNTSSYNIDIIIQ
jgi:hypothetical protein